MLQTCKSNQLKRILSGAIALGLFIAAVTDAGTCEAKTLAEQLRPNSDYGVKFEYQVNSSYQKMLNDYQKKGYAPAEIENSIIIEAKNYKKAEKDLEAVDIDGETALLWLEDNNFIEWEVNVPKSGLYNINIRYRAVDDNGADIVRALIIDGKIPFDECSNLPLYRIYKDKGEPTINNIGDQIRPGVMQEFQFQSQALTDSRGMFDRPLRFYLEAGVHNIRVALVDEPIYIQSIELFAPTKLLSYKELQEQYQAKGYTAAKESIYFEAEGKNILHKNSSNLRMSSDGDPCTRPQTIGKLIMNSIGGTAWQRGNQSITWEFEVEESGLYQLAMRYLQNYREGLPSYRKIEIDGQVPFEEWESYQFANDRKWQTKALSGKNEEPFTIYLEGGKTHTLTLTVKQGDLSELTEILTEDSIKLSENILKITMITSQTPDINYDYELDEKIPELIPSLNAVINNMRACMQIMEKVSGNKPSKYYQMENMILQFEALIKDPFIIPRRINDLNNVLSTYGDWITQFQQQPLLLDFIEWMPANQQVTNQQSIFLQRFGFSVVNFLNSFVKDYDSILSSQGGQEDKEILDVWIGRGKDWGMLLKQMADEDFTAKKGIGIRLNILPAGQVGAGSVNAMLLAISSGRAPDVGLATSTGSIAEFAMRNAVVDVSQFPDFDTVKKEFIPELFIPMTYKGGVYGLPETMNFTALAYRKDILSQLGLALPNTWDELYNKVIPVLYQNNMQFYMPGSADVKTGFSMFLYQMGGKYYTDDTLYSAFDQSQAYQAFKEYTELFTLYGVPVSANFFNRFRTGEMPLGIIDFTAYIQILSAAPELMGKWSIAQIPGHKQDDGSINRTHTGIIAESAMILSQSTQQEEAWSFLKWWMSKDVQRQYGNEIEALQGKAARWNTANREAFENMAWPRGDLKEIKKMYEQVDQIPVVMGGYFSDRHVGNAFNRVVISKQPPRDALESSIKDINRELKRRRESLLGQ